LRGGAERLLEFLDSAPGAVAIATHANADPDAVGCAVALREGVARAVGRDLQLIFPEGVSRTSRRIIERSGARLSYAEGGVEGLSGLILVDLASPGQLGAARAMLDELRGRVFLVDHHVPTRDLLELCWGAVVREEAAASVIAYEICAELGVELPREALFLVLAGILFDTRRFTHATPAALAVASEVLRHGVPYSDVVEALQQEMDLPERIARLKAAGRLRLYRLGDWLVAFTHVGSFEASAARAILSLGADAVFVVSERNEEVRVSARCTSRFREGAGLSLGEDVMPRLAELMGGSGGGHHLAGGALVRGTSEDVVAKCLEILSEKLGLEARQLILD